MTIFLFFSMKGILINIQKGDFIMRIRRQINVIMLFILLSISIFSGCSIKTYDPTRPGGVGSIHPATGGTIIASENLLAGADKILENISLQSEELFLKFDFKNYIIKEQNQSGLKNVSKFVSKQRKYVIKALPLVVEKFGHTPPKKYKDLKIQVVPDISPVAVIDRDNNLIKVSHGLIAKLYVSSFNKAIEKVVEGGSAMGSGLSNILIAKHGYKIYQDSVRFVIAHEAGHLWLHDKPQNTQEIQKNEVSADVFASYIIFSTKFKEATLVPWGSKVNALDILNIVYEGTSIKEGDLFHLPLEERRAMFEKQVLLLENEYLNEGQIWQLILGKNLKMEV